MIFEELININLRDQESNLKIWILAFLILIFFKILTVDLAVMPIKQRVTGSKPLTPEEAQAINLEHVKCIISERCIEIKIQGGEGSKQTSSRTSWQQLRSGRQHHHPHCLPSEGKSQQHHAGSGHWQIHDRHQQQHQQSQEENRKQQNI